MRFATAKTAAAIVVLFAGSLCPTMLIAEAPEGWLAWTVAGRLDHVDAAADELLKPFGMRSVGVVPMLGQFTGNALADDRPILIGLSKSHAQAVAPFLFLPLTDLDPFVRAMGLDPEEGLWVTSILGVELRLLPINQGVWVTRLRDEVPPPEEKALHALLMESDAETTLLHCVVSEEGLRALAEEGTRHRASLLEAPRGKLPRWRFPNSWQTLSDQLARYAPFVQELAQQVRTASAKLSLSGKTLQVDVRLTPHAESEKPLPPSPASQLAVDKTEVIGQFTSASGIPKIVSQIYLSLLQCGHDEVGARTFDEEAFEAYANSITALTNQVVSYHTVLVQPDDGAPLSAMETTVVRFTENTEVAKLLRQVAWHWNLLLDASHARVPLKVSPMPITRTTPEGLPLSGLDLRIDTVAALGGKQTEGLIELLEGFYGPDGICRFECIDLGKGLWLLSRLPVERTNRLAQKLSNASVVISSPSASETTLLEGAFHFDRYQTWDQRIEDYTNHETVGYRKRPPMTKSPPVTLRLLPTGAKETDFRATIRMSLATYRSVVTYWRTPKRAVSDETR